MQNFHVFMGMHPDDILQDLKDQKIFDSQEIAEIKSQGRRREQMEVLLSKLYAKGPATCRMFLNILGNNEYGIQIKEMRVRGKSCMVMTL